MSDYKQKPGTGVLFANKNKQNEKHPSFKGTIALPDGTEYRISAWTKSGQKGEYLSLAIDQWDGNKSQGNTAPISGPSPTNNLPF